MTEPDGTVVLDAVVMAPIVKPAAVIAVVAAACVRLTTPGTATSGGPGTTSTAATLPRTLCGPATPLRMLTPPDGTVVLDAVVMAPIVKPAEVIAVVAAACVRLTTSGTVTGGRAGTTSTAAKFQRMLVGAVTPSRTLVPAFAISTAQ